MSDASGTPCPSCGQVVPSGNRFCGNCGTRLAETSDGATAAPASLDALFAHLSTGEQRPVTILMTDITGFSSLGERLHPEELYQLLNEVFSELVPILTLHGAHIDKFVGDEIMALFGAPLAMDRCAESAVLAALALRDRLDQMLAEGRFGDIRLRLHTGINLGLVMVGPLGSDQRLDYTVIGDAVNLAKRLEDEAEAGEIYISDAVRESAGPASASTA